jgi:hypothetical protein
LFGCQADIQEGVHQAGPGQPTGSA